METYRALLDLAERHRGLVTLTEVADSGIDKHVMARLVRAGVVVPIHARRVYSVGCSALDFEQRAIAASLAAPDGWISGVACGRLSSLRGMPIDRLELTVPSARQPHLRGVRVRRTRLHEPDVVEGLDGLRLSTVAQCLFEVSFELDDLALRSAHEDALARGLVTEEALAEVGRRAIRMGRNGSERYRRVILGRAGETPPVMSRDELVLLDALEQAGLPMQRQYPLTFPEGTTIHLDGARPEIRFGLEVDGPTHLETVQVQRDKHRDLRAAGMNWQVVRPTTDDVRRRLGLTVRRVLAAVEARRRLFG